MTEILYCQSPALFLLAVVLLICFFLRRQAHRVRAALDLILCILLLIGGDRKSTRLNSSHRT